MELKRGAIDPNALFLPCGERPGLVCVRDRGLDALGERGSDDGEAVAAGEAGPLLDRARALSGSASGGGER